MKRILIDGHDKIKGAVTKPDGSVLAHCVQSVNWEGAYQFTYVVQWRSEAINVILIKEPNQSGSLQIKIDGLYVEHTLFYEDILRGYEWFRDSLYFVIRRYYNQH